LSFIYLYTVYSIYQMANFLFFGFISLVILFLVLCACVVPSVIRYIDSTSIHSMVFYSKFSNLLNSISLLYHSLQVSLNPFMFLYFILQNLMIGSTFYIHQFFDHDTPVLYYLNQIMSYGMWGTLFIISALWLVHGLVKLYDAFDNATSITMPLILNIVLHSTLATLAFLQYGADILTAIFAVDVIILLYLTYKIANPPKTWKFKS